MLCGAFLSWAPPLQCLDTTVCRLQLCWKRRLCGSGGDQQGVACTAAEKPNLHEQNFQLEALLWALGHAL